MLNNNQFTTNQDLGNPYAQNLTIVKDYFKRPIVLVTIIVSFLTLIASTTSYFFNSNATYTTFNTIIENGHEFRTEYITEMPFALKFLFTLLSSAPAIFLLIALIIIYTKSKNPSPHSSPSAGFTIGWVFAILKLIGTILLFAYIIIIFSILSIFLTNTNNNYFSDFDSLSSTAALIVFFATFAVFFGVALFYAINNLRYYSSLRKSIRTIYLERKGAAPYGVMSIIGGSCALFLSVSLLFLINFSTSDYLINSFLNPGENSLAYISYMTLLLSGVQSILTGIIAVGYNNHIRTITSTYKTPETFTSSNLYSAGNPMSEPGQYIGNSGNNKFLNQNNQGNQKVKGFTSAQNIAEPNNDIENIAKEDNVTSPVVTVTETIDETDDVKEETMSCPNCGKTISKSSKFCRFCGKKLNANNEED